VLFTFDDDFPKDERKPEAERVLAARLRGKTAQVVVSAGMHVHIRENKSLPWQPIEPQRGRGRPRKASAGTWEDDDLLAEVSEIVGSRDERAQLGAEVYEGLKVLTRRVLGRPVTSAEDKTLRRLFYGTSDVRPEKAGVIVRQLLVWRHHVSDPDVRRMQRSLRQSVTHLSTVLVLKYDEQGQPVCDDHGRPILWIADEYGQPSHPHLPGEERPVRRITVVRPRVKMTFR